MSLAAAKAERVTLQTLLITSPLTAALKNGQIASPLIDFAYADVKLAHDAFKPMVRELRFDAGELAIVTFLQAKAHGIPLVLMPAVVVGRFQHDGVAYNSAYATLAPGDLKGKRLAVRSTTQTTVVWSRGILADEYGVDFDSVKTVAFDKSHVPQYVEPASIEWAPPGKTLNDMLLKGEVDAAVVGTLGPKDPQIKPLIPDAGAAARAWYQKHKVVPINHIMVVKRSLSQSRPDLVREIFRLLLESKKAAGLPAGDVDFNSFGLDAIRAPLEMIIDFSYRQKLIPRRLTVDELFDDVTRNLKP